MEISHQVAADECLTALYPALLSFKIPGFGIAERAADIR